jgi:hypothetical protein
MWEHIRIVSATWEAEARGWFEPMSSTPARAKQLNLISKKKNR